MIFKPSNNDIPKIGDQITLEYPISITEGKDHIEIPAGMIGTIVEVFVSSSCPKDRYVVQLEFEGIEVSDAIGKVSIYVNYLNIGPRSVSCSECTGCNETNCPHYGEIEYLDGTLLITAIDRRFSSGYRNADYIWGTDSTIEIE